MDIGIRLTPQRIEILNYLKGNKKHPSAEEIYKDVSKKFPTMSFATVYNTLETLKQKGHILELSIDSDRKRYDPMVKSHHHLICINCKKIVDVHNNYNIEISEKDKNGFSIMGNHINFYGVCPLCKGTEDIPRQAFGVSAQSNAQDDTCHDEHVEP